jgi:Zn-dependent peptidase ImmA (M78 family)
MEFYMSEKFKIATEKANLVIGKLNIKENDFIKTEDLVDVVEELTNAKILVTETDFEKINKSAKCYGAMMNINNGKDNIFHLKSVIIVLNSNRCIDAKFKRFSLVHELGHLITEKYTFSDEKKEVYFEYAY